MRLLANVKSNDIHADLARYVETRTDTSNYEVEKPLHKKKQQSHLADEKIMDRWWQFWKGTKKGVIKLGIKFGDYKKFLENDKKSMKITAMEFCKLKVHLRQSINI